MSRFYNYNDTVINKMCGSLNYYFIRHKAGIRIFPMNHQIKM